MIKIHAADFRFSQLRSQKKVFLSKVN